MAGYGSGPGYESSITNQFFLPSLLTPLAANPTKPLMPLPKSIGSVKK